MTLIPSPWRVVSKACTACSSEKRWVTRGLTFTFLDANIEMATGQLEKQWGNMNKSVQRSKILIWIVLTTINLFYLHCTQTPEAVICKSQAQVILLTYYSSGIHLWCQLLWQLHWEEVRWSSRYQAQPAPPLLQNGLPRQKHHDQHKIRLAVALYFCLKLT